MNTFLPGLRSARSFSACHDVNATIGIEAACTKSRFAGLCAATLSGTRANSARAPPAPRSKMLANTASPGLNRVTRLPTSTTVPAKSLPSVAGSSNLRMGLNVPFGIMLSIGLRPAAWTWTRSSSGSNATAKRTAPQANPSWKARLPSWKSEPGSYQCAVKPPSTGRPTPITKLAAGLHSHSTAAATSSARPRRPIDCCFMISAIASA